MLKLIAMQCVGNGHLEAFHTCCALSVFATCVVDGNSGFLDQRSRKGLFSSRR